MESHHDDRLKQQVIKKAFIRLMPVLLFAYVLAYLDRVNISFAGLTMMEDLGLSAKLFGYGTGIFFIGYFLFELPSNLLLTKFGARRWISRIISVFMLSIPLSLAVGAPLSTALLGLNGIGGLHGWQWLFIIEGIPTVLVGLLFLFAMPDRPKDAK